MAPKKKPSQSTRKQPRRTPSTPSSKTATPVSKRMKSKSESPQKQDEPKTPQREIEQKRKSLDSTASSITLRSAGKTITPTDYPHGRRRTSMFTPRRAILKTPSRTPFRTPRIKSLGDNPRPDLTQASKLHREDAIIWKEQLKTFINKQLSLCYLSSMRNFKYNSKNLRKQYEGTLKRMVEEVFVSQMITVQIRTTSFFSLVPNVVDGVYIKINSLIPGITVQEDKEVNVYSCWLFKTTHVQSKKMAGVEWFPLMLYSGRTNIHYAVVDWLQGSFDCYVTRRQLRQIDLLWITGVWGGRKCLLAGHQRGNGNSIDFTYYIRHPDGINKYPPPNTRVRPKLVLQLDMDDVHHIWENIIDTSRDEMSVEELQLFFETLSTCSQKLTALPPELLQLHQVQTPCLSINGSGKVKLTCIRSASTAVKHLMDIFIQTSNCYVLEDHLIKSDDSEASTNVFMTDDEDE